MSRRSWAYVVLTTAVGQIPLPLHAVARHYVCDVKQGLHPIKSINNSVGYLNAIQVGATTLKPDFQVPDPLHPDQTLAVVGIASEAGWGGGVEDPIALSCLVSAENRQVLAKLLGGTQAPALVAIRFAIYARLPGDAAYYTCFQGGEEGPALKGAKAAMDLAEAPSAEAPETFNLYLELHPGTEAQTLHFASTKVNDRLEQWGGPKPK